MQSTLFHASDVDKTLQGGETADEAQNNPGDDDADDILKRQKGQSGGGRIKGQKAAGIMQKSLVKGQQQTHGK